MQTTTTYPSQSAQAARLAPLPLAGLLALAMTGFIAILTETLPACRRRSAPACACLNPGPAS